MDGHVPIDEIEDHLAVALGAGDASEKDFHIRQARQMLRAAGPSTDDVSESRV